MLNYSVSMDVSKEDEAPHAENVETTVKIDGESITSKHMDQLASGTRIEVTEEDVSTPPASLLREVVLSMFAQSKRLCRKTDKHILSVLVWVYFLQILDKSVLGYGAVWGLRTDCRLSGDEYSTVSSMSSIAQLVCLPLASWLMVRVPHRLLMTALVFGWGTAQACMAACDSYAGLLATRFLLGLFEAACLPLFSVITAQWYRRAEQPMRVACSSPSCSPVGRPESATACMEAATP